MYSTFISQLEYFFRSAPDNTSFQGFGALHLGLLTIIFLFSIILIRHLSCLSDTLKGIIRYFIVITLSIQLILLYLWYAFGGFSGLKESLPLFTCRVAIFSSVFALITKKRLYQMIATYWGFVGGVVALVIPQPDPFHFPHFSNFSYFIGHGFLIYSLIFIIIEDKYDFGYSDLKSIITISTIFHFLVYFINKAIGANYCYMISSPIAKEFFSRSMNEFTYSFLVVFIFNILMYATHLTLDAFSRQTLRNERNVF